MMKDSDYAEATGVIRAVEKRLLGAAALQRALEAPTVADALRMLSQISEYDFGTLKRSADYEDVLKRELKRVYGFMYRLSPVPDVVEILSLKYDYHNVKAALKAPYAGADASGILYGVTRTPPGAVLKAVKTGDVKEFPEHLTDAVAQGKAAYEKTGAPGGIDLALDRLMFAEMHSRADRLDNEFILEYVQKSIDFYNLKTLFRIRAMGGGDNMRLLKSALADGGTIPAYFFGNVYARGAEAVQSGFQYQFLSGVVKNALEDHGRSGHYARLEKLADEHLTEHIKRAKMVAFGPEPLFAYLCAKETEMKQIRVILTGKLNKIPGELLQKRLRECYA